MSIIQDDRKIPLDLRYTDFLHSLSYINDENMRDRCHKHWTSLYRYFDRSMINERALSLEEKRIYEILHRLDIEIASRRSEVACQIRNILQRGHQLLADLHIKYNKKRNDLKEIQQNINNLENKIQKQKPTSITQITETISNLKLEIKNLQITRRYLKKIFIILS